MPKSVYIADILREKDASVIVPTSFDEIDANSIELPFRALIAQINELNYKKFILTSALNNYTPPPPPEDPENPDPDPDPQPNNNYARIQTIFGLIAGETQSQIVYDRDLGSTQDFNADGKEVTYSATYTGHNVSSVNYSWDIQGVGIIAGANLTYKATARRQLITMNMSVNYNDGNTAFISQDFTVISPAIGLELSVTSNLFGLYGSSIQFTVRLILSPTSYVTQGTLTVPISSLAEPITAFLPVSNVNATDDYRYQYRVLALVVENKSYSDDLYATEIDPNAPVGNVRVQNAKQLLDIQAEIYKGSQDSVSRTTHLVFS